MEKLYSKCRDIIEKSTSCSDEDIIDYLTVSFMALYLLKGSIILDRLPSIIESVNLDKNNLNKVDLNLGIYSENGEIKNKNILGFPDSIEPNQYYGVIENTIYYLLSLLRMKVIKSDTDFVEIKTGISSKRIGYDGTVINGRGNFFEKGILNITVRDAMSALRNYLTEDYDDGICDDYYSELVKDRLFVYDVRVHLIDELLTDDKFKSLVEETFIDLDDKGFAKGYNNIMDNDAAYSNLNRLFNNLSQSLVDGDEDSIKKNISLIYDEITGLKNKNGQYKKNK